MTLNEASKKYGISKQTIYNWIHYGLLFRDGVKRERKKLKATWNHGCYRISPTEIETYIKNRWEL